jgi:hypothetical protein
MPRADEELPDVDEAELLFFPCWDEIGRTLGQLHRLESAIVAECNEDRIDPHFWHEWFVDVHTALLAWNLLFRAYDLPPPVVPEHQRAALRELRDLIGAKAYAARRMPFVPPPPRLHAPWIR